MGLSIFDEVQPTRFQQTINSGTGLGLLYLVNGQTQKGRLDAMYARNTDGIDHVLTVYLGNGGTGIPLGSVNIPSAPLAGVGVPVEVLAALGLTAEAGIVLGPGDQIEIGVQVAVVTGAIYVNGLGGWL